MDYKKEIIGMIQKIESVRFLAMIYSFTHTLFEKEKKQGDQTIEGGVWETMRRFLCTAI